MRRSLFPFPCLAILALPVAWAVPAAWADSPFSVAGSNADSLSSMLASTEQHSIFHYRFVTFLREDDSLALNDVDDQSQDDGSDLKLMLIEGDDEERDTDAANDQDSITENRVREAIDSAIPNVGSDHDRATATRPSDAAQHSDDARLATRLAELNKPATLLRVAAPTTRVGEAPVNQAAQIFDQTPLWIHGGLISPPLPQRVHVAFYHNPTYFQELNLERCGRLDCARCGYLQNLYSSVWFVGNTAMLPYRLASQPPCECVISYGDCPSCHQYDCPIEPLWIGDDGAATRRGMLSQSAALAGFVLLLW